MKNDDEFFDFLLLNDMLDDDDKKSSGGGCVGCFLLILVLPIGWLIRLSQFSL